MKSVYNFVVTPVKNRYNNTKDIDGKELIVNTEIFNHQYVSREAIVKAIPTVGKTDIKVGDTVIVHHNVFRRWIDIRGQEKNSSSFLKENEYFVAPDQIFAYRRNDKWHCPDEYFFVIPFMSEEKWAPYLLKALDFSLI